MPSLRRGLNAYLEESPSLRRETAESIRKAYPKARELAADETGIIEKDFPRNCPYTEAEILDGGFWPE
jgi:hypothetical protein